jgi:membrane carboxypeptidase/penicillin-binding protein PbpC
MGEKYLALSELNIEGQFLGFAGKKTGKYKHLQLGIAGGNIKIKIPKNLDGSVSKTVFQLAHRRPEKTVYWHIDGEFVGKTRIYHQMIMNPGIGRHLMMAMDEDGNRIETTFEIMSFSKR